MTTHLSQTKPN